jgi:hypothetical protein
MLAAEAEIVAIFLANESSCDSLTFMHTETQISCLVYTQSLLSDPSIATASTDIHSVASKELKYLEKRSDFWRQQKPVYARQHEQKLLKTLQASTRVTKMYVVNVCLFRCQVV